MDKCLICFNELDIGVSILDYFKKKDVICGKCRSKMIEINKWFKIDSLDIFVLYLYNDFLESILFQFKEGKDIALKEVFISAFKKQIFDKFKGYTIVYLPSSVKKIEERGFFPLEEMLMNINLAKVSLFEKKKEYKQSLQSYPNREKIKDVIVLKKDVNLPNTNLLLIDDVCTSGSTLKYAYELIKDHPFKVKALVLCANALFVE